MEKQCTGDRRPLGSPVLRQGTEPGRHRRKRGRARSPAGGQVNAARREQPMDLTFPQLRRLAADVRALGPHRLPHGMARHDDKAQPTRGPATSAHQAWRPCLPQSAKSSSSAYQACPQIFSPVNVQRQKYTRSQSSRSTAVTRLADNPQINDPAPPELGSLPGQSGRTSPNSATRSTERTIDLSFMAVIRRAGPRGPPRGVHYGPNGVPKSPSTKASRKLPAGSCSHIKRSKSPARA